MFDNCQFSVEHNLSRTSQQSPLILQESNNNKKVWITKTNILKLNLNQLDCFSVIVYYYGPNVGPIYCQFVKFLLDCDKSDNR